MNPISFCEYPNPSWLILSSNVPPLVHYSHLPILIIAFLIGLFVLSKGRKMLANQILFGVLFFFSLWVLLDSIFWAANRSDVVMFVWSLQILFEPLIHIGAFYLIYVITKRKDVSIKVKALFFLLYLPLIVLVPTEFTLSGFDLTSCLATEHPFSYYTYVIELLATISIIIFTISQYIKIKVKEKRTELLFISLGIILFLLSFSWGAIVGSFTDDWGLAQYGLFGMPIFAAFLAYSTVRFNVFNIRLVGTQALILGLVSVTGSQFFFVSSATNLYLNVASFILVVIFGYLLIRSVKREIEAREKVQKLAEELQTVNTSLAEANTRLKELNQQKTEFISFATHQLRSPLTAIHGNASLILEGDLGPVPKPIKEVVEIINSSIKTQINIVEDYLNLSRIELGTMKYNLVKINLGTTLAEVVTEQKTNIEAKNLTWSLSISTEGDNIVKADPDKFKQVLTNIIDNSIKYTPAGTISVSLERDALKRVLRVKIADTGTGIPTEIMPKLFQKFSRAPNASAVNIHGTGLGLYLAKEIMNAHGGRVWAESEGEGKGSQFYIELPEVK